MPTTVESDPFRDVVVNSGYPVRVNTDPYAGRSYRAAHALPSGTVLFDVPTPYTYNIYKRFRNEVCAECWRYEGGRKAFLTRRDDHGYGASDTTSASVNGAPERNDGETNGRGKNGKGKGKAKEKSPGLYFCDAICQASWIDREGADALHALSILEGARSSKEGEAGDETFEAAQELELTQDTIERAWDAVRAREAAGGWKEARRWSEIQLDDYETDMARYVLLAVLRLHREQQAAASLSSDGETRGNLAVGGDWRTFSSLQNNELQLLRPLPALITHQIRIYQALKGRLASGRMDNKQSGADRQIGKVGEELDLREVLSIDNVRTALGVDPGNSFGIWEVPVMEESECLGFGVYPVLSLFNHSCAPNVRKVHAGRGMRFVTTREVGAGEELCISYGHVEVMDWRKRRQELMDGWFFECRCPRCMAEMEAHRGEEP